jgi:hypothetical protein
MDMKVVNPDSLKPGNYEVWFKVDSIIRLIQISVKYCTKGVPKGDSTFWSVRRVINASSGYCIQ